MFLFVITQAIWASTSCICINIIFLALYNILKAGTIKITKIYVLHIKRKK